jgi:hypothetical protein
MALLQLLSTDLVQGVLLKRRLYLLAVYQALFQRYSKSPQFEALCLQDGLNFYSRNIVATVNLDCRLDLKTIALHARNAEYNPKVQHYILYGSNDSVLRQSSCGFVIQRPQL